MFGRQEINLYIGGVLSLASDTKSVELGRLVELAESSDDLIEFLRDWCLLHDRTIEDILLVKLWFSMSYRELALVFEVSDSEVTQRLRAVRMASLTPYRLGSPRSIKSEGFSCFMVDQFLSPWIDGELQNAEMAQALIKHLNTCANCQSRLEAYRELNRIILESRKYFEAISDAEWTKLVHNFHGVQRQRWRRVLILSFLIILVGISVAWGLRSRQEKIPNVYEIPEDME